MFRLAKTVTLALSTIAVGAVLLTATEGHAATAGSREAAEGAAKIKEVMTTKFPDSRYVQSLRGL